MFSQNLRRAMNERNISQTQLSALTGLAKSGISQYLSGKTTPNEKAKGKLADALEVAVAFLDGAETCPGDPLGLRNVSIKQAAERLGKSRQFVRVLIQSGKAPFGYAVKVGGNRYTYHISPKKFMEYAGDDDHGAVSVPAPNP